MLCAGLHLVVYVDNNTIGACAHCQQTVEPNVRVLTPIVLTLSNSVIKGIEHSEPTMIFLRVRGCYIHCFLDRLAENFSSNFSVLCRRDDDRTNID